MNDILIMAIVTGVIVVVGLMVSYATRTWLYMIPTILFAGVVAVTLHIYAPTKTLVVYDIVTNNSGIVSVLTVNGYDVNAYQCLNPKECVDLPSGVRIFYEKYEAPDGQPNIIHNVRRG